MDSNSLVIESKIKKYNFQYIIDYDYDEIYDCENYGCIDDDICRCSKIINFKIKNVIPNEMASFFMDKFYTKNKKTSQYYFQADEKIFEYALDRLWSHYIKKYCVDSIFETDIKHSYYGEEVFSITLNNTNMIKTFNEITYLNNDELIEKILTVEYGYLLERLEGCHYEPASVGLDSIHISNTKYYDKKLDEGLVEEYNDYPSFVALIDEDNRIIDGYHRIAAAKNQGKTDVLVLKAIKNG